MILTNKKTDWGKIFIEVSTIISVVGGIAIIFAGNYFSMMYTRNFYVSFHNVDLSFNSLLWSNDLNAQGIDMNFRGISDRYGLGENDTISLSDSYIKGNNDMVVSFRTMPLVTFGIVLGIFLVIAGLVNYMLHLRSLMFKEGA